MDFRGMYVMASYLWDKRTTTGVVNRFMEWLHFNSRIVWIQGAAEGTSEDEDRPEEGASLS